MRKPAKDLTDLCTVLYGWAETAWDRLLRDAPAGGTPEPYLTHDLMSLLDERFGHLTHIWRQQSFDGRAEGGESGPNADWEWWLGDAEGWNGIRVQAKKMDPNTGRYPDLNNNQDKKRQQANWLILNAAAHPGRPAPLYCFYNAWDDDPAPFASPVTTMGLRRDYGATIVNAHSVLDRLTERIDSPVKPRPAIDFTSFVLVEHHPLAQLFCSGTQTPRAQLTAWIEAEWGIDDATDLPRPATTPVAPGDLPWQAQALITAAAGSPAAAESAQARLVTRGVHDDDPGTVIVTAQDEDTFRATVERLSSEQ